MIKFNKAFHIEISICSNSLGKLQHCQTCYFFGRGEQKKYIASAIYHICDISHLRYSKEKKTEAAGPSNLIFKASGQRKTTSAICVLPFRGQGQGRGRVQGGLLQWQVNSSSILFI